MPSWLRGCAFVAVRADICCRCYCKETINFDKAQKNKTATTAFTKTVVYRHKRVLKEKDSAQPEGERL